MSQSAIASIGQKFPRCRSRASPRGDWKLPRCSSPPSGDRIPLTGICTRIASARLRAPNQKLLELARSQSEVIGKAKDISPLEKPSLCRVLKLASPLAWMSPFAVTVRWILSMGTMKRGFKKLRHIWELLIVEDWLLTELFCPPPLPVVPKFISTATHTRYSVIPDPMTRSISGVWTRSMLS